MLNILLGEFHRKLKDLKLFSREATFPNAPNKIKIAIGMRRTGKTYFLYQQILEMIKTGIELSSILYINFEDDRLLPLNEKKLAELVDSFYTLYPENHEKKCYLFFDEIQNVDNWPLVIRRLHDTKNVEIFLTGSSAKLLSKEIATSLRGRSLAIEIWPFSFKEFLLAKNISIDSSLFDKKAFDKLSKLFNSYLSAGGFPETIFYSSDVLQQTLQEYVDVAIFRDIIERHNIKNPSLIKYLIISMIHHLGKPFSINKFYNDAKTRGYPIGKDTLYDYVEHIEDAYLSFFVDRFDKSIRARHTHPKKVYAIDTGVVRSLTLDYEKDLGRLFENIVYLELRSLGYKVSYYQTDNGYEVDFLAETPRGEKKLFQVAWDIKDSKTLEREKRALEDAKKELKIEGEIISLPSYLEYIYGKIKKV